jgi:hypothetical protein
MSSYKVLNAASQEVTQSVLDTKKRLIEALQMAARLEHEFMCQYLYAVLSLKKQPDERCNAAQLEAVRRWGSQAYKVARQEMQHLSVVNSLLVAIGGEPCFSHDSIPLQHRWYMGAMLAEKLELGQIPCDLPFVLNAFDLNTVRRFACMEAPKLDGASPLDRDTLSLWCFQDDTGRCSCVAPTGDVTTVDLGNDSITLDSDVVIGTVGELYRALKAGFYHLSADPDVQLFTGAKCPQTEIPSEYKITLWPITDLASAIDAIDLVLEQGEGDDSPPGFACHCQDWMCIAREYKEILDADDNFVPYVNVVPNPKLDSSSDSWVREAMKVENAGYILICYMLTGLYGNYPYWPDGGFPHLSPSLLHSVFAPMMTMFTRSMGEILVKLPLDPSNPDGYRAGPTFHIGEEADELLKQPHRSEFRQVEFYRTHLERIRTGLEHLLKTIPSWVDNDVKRRLTFMCQNMARLNENLRYVNANGPFPNFVE